MTTKKVKPEHGMSTIVNHVGEGGHDKHAHLMPIYQTSTFGFDTVEEAGEVLQARKNPTRIREPATRTWII